MKLLSHLRAILATRKARMIRRNAIRDYRQAMRLAINLERTALRFKRLSGPPLLSGKRTERLQWIPLERQHFTTHQLVQQ